MKRRPRFFVSIIAAMLTFGALTAHIGWRHTTKCTVAHRHHIVKKATKFKKA